MARWPGVFLMLAAMLAWGGCDRWGAGNRNEALEANYLEGVNYQLQNNTNRAIQSFERALHVNPSNYHAHLAIAGLFFKTGDFTSAAYHYRRCARLREERGQPAESALQQMIESCDFNLAVEFSDRIGQRQTDATIADLRRRLAERDDAIVKLRDEIGRLKDAGQRAAPPTQATAPPALVADPAPVPAVRQRADPEPPRGPVVRGPSAPAPSAQTTAPSPAVRSLQSPAPSPSVRSPQTPSPSSTPSPAPSSRQAVTPPRPSATRPPARPATRMRAYVVRSGDTPAAIARRAGISTQAFMAANPGLNPNRMRPGQVVNVPNP